HRDLRHRLLHGAQLDLRRVDDDRVRRGRLRAEEDGLFAPRAQGRDRAWGAPLLLAIVLGDRADASFRQAMLVSQGDLTVFFSNGLVGTMTGLAVALLLWPLVSWGWSRVRA